MDMKIEDFHSCDEDLYWRGCYNAFPNWRRFVTAESFAHPAKMSPMLCDRIFKHLKKLGLLHEDSVVCDFMCYDDQTEVLTKRGWLFFKKVHYGDEICTLNTENSEIEYQKPTKIIREQYSGKMYFLSTKQINICVTPNHNLYIAFRNPRSPRREWKFKLASAFEIFRKPVLFKKNGIWKGIDKEKFILPAAEHHMGRWGDKYRNIPPKEIDIGDWLSFFGFYLAEGYLTADNGHHYPIALANNDRGLLGEVKEIVNRIGFSCSIIDNDLRINNKQLYLYLSQFGKSEGKFVPDEIKELPPQKLKILLDWYLKGDGNIWKPAGRKTSRITCWTSSTKLRDDLQEIALKIGWSANYYLATASGEIHFAKKMRTFITARNDNWCIRFNSKQNTPISNFVYNIWVSNRRKTNPSFKEEWIEYNGEIYCVTVPNHVIYIRRCGKPVWCGNSGIGTTNIMASLHGYDSIAVELEPHFVKMINDNKERWRRLTGKDNGWDVIQGDARELSTLLREKGYAGVVSPPFADTIGNFTHERGDLQKYFDRQKRYNEKISGAMGIKRPEPLQYSINPNNIGNLPDKPVVGIISPPYSNSLDEKKNTTSNLRRAERLRTSGHLPKDFMGGTARNCQLEDGMRYSRNPNNIGNLPDKVGQRCGYMKEMQGGTEGQIGNLKDIVGIISPAYPETIAPVGGEGAATLERVGISTRTSRRYSCNPQNIGNLQDSSLVGITSPPYEEAMGIKHTDCPSYAKLCKDKHWNTKYSTNRENIGAIGGETYLEAMFKVYKEAYLAGISPLVIVTKNPTRDFKLRRLDIDTAELLMMVGYAIIDYHRAVLFEEKQQLTLTGDIMKVPKGRLSFFKRLGYNKGNVTAKWEDVFFTVA